MLSISQFAVSKHISGASINVSWSRIGKNFAINWHNVCFIDHGRSAHQASRKPSPYLPPATVLSDHHHVVEFRSIHNPEGPICPSQVGFHATHQKCYVGTVPVL